MVSLDSDKFTFPDGNTRTLILDRPTTPVRIQARSRTSGDRLPVGVTLTTPDGQLVIARAALTVHSTSISLVGVALTCLAALVLLVWWVRTWRRVAGGARGPPDGDGPRVPPVSGSPARRRGCRSPPPPPTSRMGTGVSRLTGLLRIVALAWALGQSHLADAFNLANTTPNMLYDIVLGGVLSATFIPVFVDQLANRTKERGVHVHFGRALGLAGRPASPRRWRRWCWRPSSSRH